MASYVWLDERIVPWANEGVWIPIRCTACDAIFTTKNNVRIGARPIHYGSDYPSCTACVDKGHPIRLLVPDKEVYLQGSW